MKKQHYLAIFFLVFMLAVVYKVTSSSLPSSAQPLELLEEAIDNEVPVWLLFHSNTCEPCIEMKAVFNSLAPEYHGEIAFIPVLVSDSANQDLIRSYEIRYIPTNVLVDRSGDVESLWVGVKTQSEMIDILDSLSGGE